MTYFEMNPHRRADKNKQHFSAYLESTGNGENIHLGNGTVITPEEFYFEATESVQVTDIIILIDDDGPWGGALALAGSISALSNGIEFQVNGIPLWADVKNNMDFFIIGHSQESQLPQRIFSGNTRLMLILWNADVAKQRISLLSGERVRILIKDNISALGLNFFKCLIRGWNGN